MKAIVEKNDLRDAVSKVARAAAKTTTPITTGILLETSGAIVLNLRATNFALNISTKIPANAEAEGKALVNAAHLNAIVPKLAGEIVTLASDGSTLTLKSDAATFTLPAMNADDFPAPLNIDNSGTCAVYTRDMKDLIRHTAFACAKKDDRAVLRGVQFEISTRKFVAAATNAHRIAVYNTTYGSTDNFDAKFIVPAANLYTLAGILEDGVPVTIGIDDRHVHFYSGGTDIISTLIDGELPPLDKVIPATFKTTAELNVAELRAALARMKIIADEAEYSTVFMVFTQDGLELSADATDKGAGKALEHVDALVTGDDIQLAFNSNYLAEMLNVTGAKTVRIGLNSPLSPALITNTTDDGFTYVVTPLRTR